MLELPNPPWYRRWSFLLAGIIGLAVVAGLLGWRGLQQVATPAPTTAVTVTTVPQPSTTTTRGLGQPSTTITRARARPGVLWEHTGSDTHHSKLFRAPRNWRIVWSFDCSDFAGGRGGNFKLTGEGAFEQVLIQEFDVKASGSRSVTGGGFGRLVITSVCDRWTVRALRA
jgi:hypothetical protein